MVATRDVELTESRVWTTHPVEFRFGASYGRGQQMLIKLLGSDESAPGEQRRAGRSPASSRSRSRRLEQLHLEFGGSRSRVGRRPVRVEPSSGPDCGRPADRGLLPGAVPLRADAATGDV